MIAIKYLWSNSLSQQCETEFTSGLDFSHILTCQLARHAKFKQIGWFDSKITSSRLCNVCIDLIRAICCHKASVCLSVRCNPALCQNY